MRPRALPDRRNGWSHCNHGLYRQESSLVSIYPATNPRWPAGHPPSICRSYCLRPLFQSRHAAALKTAATPRGWNATNPHTNGIIRRRSPLSGLWLQAVAWELSGPVNGSTSGRTSLVRGCTNKTSWNPSLLRRCRHRRVVGVVLEEPSRKDVVAAIAIEIRDAVARVEHQLDVRPRAPPCERAQRLGQLHPIGVELDRHLRTRAGVAPTTCRPRRTPGSAAARCGRRCSVAHHQRHAAIREHDNRHRQHDQRQDRYDERRPHSPHPACLLHAHPYLGPMRRWVVLPTTSSAWPSASTTAGANAKDGAPTVRLTP